MLPCRPGKGRCGLTISGETIGDMQVRKQWAIKACLLGASELTWVWRMFKALSPFLTSPKTDL